MKKLALLFSVLGFASAYIDPNAKWVELLIPPGEHALPSSDTTPDKRIVNGDVAQPGLFPYQALVLSYFDHDETALCGGTLLSQNYVLTAAHCVEWDGIATHGTVILGVIYRQAEELTQQRIDFDTVNVHPGWLLPTVSYDIATIRLSSPAVFNEYVQPVELPALSDTRSFAGITGTISGFGRTNDIPGSPASDFLRYTRNPILTNSHCRSLLNSFPLGPQHICFSAFGSRSACHGDSGGPLTVREGDRTVQVGIASFVVGGMCAVGVPVGYVRVTYFLDWIAENSDVVLRS